MNAIILLLILLLGIIVSIYIPLKIVMFKYELYVN